MPAPKPTSSNARRAARAAITRGARALVPAVRMTGRALAATGAFVWRHREIVRALAVRVAWWGALVAWWTVALELLGGGPLDIERALLVFATGAAVCAMVVVLGRASRMRWWGGALGSVHGMCAVIVWLVANA